MGKERTVTCACGLIHWYRTLGHDKPTLCCKRCLCGRKLPNEKEASDGYETISHR